MALTLAAKNLDSPDESRRFSRGRMDVVTVAGVTVGRAVFEPGWRWSDDVAPVAGTGSCQVAHVGYIVSGRLAVRMDDGTEAVAGAGDAVVVSPGHDGWVVGDEPCVMLDWAGGADYARGATERSAVRELEKETRS